MSRTSEFLKRVDIRWPIIQAPMAGISTPEMAAAVSNSGGLGSLSVGAMKPTEAVETVDRFRQLSNRSLNINVFCHAPALSDTRREKEWLKSLEPEFQKFGFEPPASLREIYRSFIEDDEMLDVILDLRPKVLSFHFGLPSSERIHKLRAAGIFLFATTTNPKEAMEAETAGVDAIVAQGYEAGGHRGVFDPDAEDPCLATAELVQILVSKSKLPVIAAGGIMNGLGIAKVLGLGAVAAQLGTAFLASDESAADDAYRHILKSEAAQNTRMTRVISGRPARCLPNRFVEWGLNIHGEHIPAYPMAYDAGKSLNAAARAKGNFGYGAHWAGEGAPQAKSISTKSLMDELLKEIKSNF